MYWIVKITRNKCSEWSIISAWYLSFKSGMMWRMFNSRIGQIGQNTINRNVVYFLFLFFIIWLVYAYRHVLLHGVFCLKTVCVTMDPYQSFVLKQAWLFATSYALWGLEKESWYVDTQQGAPGWDSNLGPLQRGHSLCTWNACSTNWANGSPCLVIISAYLAHCFSGFH